jgi:hypothetical protein
MSAVLRKVRVKSGERIQQVAEAIFGANEMFSHTDRMMHEENRSIRTVRSRFNVQHAKQPGLRRKPVVRTLWRGQRLLRKLQHAQFCNMP